MKITGAEVFGNDNSFHYRDIFIKDDKFTGENEDDEITDARGCYAIPGLIDIHFHGALGADVCDGTPEAFEKIAGYELSRGVTSICPATLTLPVSQLREILRVGAEFASKKRTDVSEIIGFNMEGPFISREKKGAQNGDFISKCSAETAREFVEASGGLLKIIGLAPEENPGFEDFISRMKDCVRISLAHTGSDYETAVRAFDAGASHAVHLYNAMTGLCHRDPGVVGAVADRREVTAELICDGIHIHPAVVRTTFRMLGGERIAMISDSLRTTGMPDGFYDLGGQRVEKKGRICRLCDGGAIAGSSSDLMDCLVRSVKEMGIPLEAAVRSCTLVPALAIGEGEKYGTIEPGKQADLVLLDKQDLSLREVYKKGKRLGKR